MSHEDTKYFTMDAWKITVMDIDSTEKHEHIFLNYFVEDALNNAVEWYKGKGIRVMAIQAIYLGPATYGTIL